MNLSVHQKGQTQIYATLKKNSSQNKPQHSTMFIFASQKKRRLQNHSFQTMQLLQHSTQIEFEILYSEIQQRK